MGMMEVQTMINVGGGVILTGIGWFARQLWDATERLKRDLHALEVDLPKSYVTKDDFVSAVRDIRHDIDTGLKRIYDKLDGKADK